MSTTLLSVLWPQNIQTCSLPKPSWNRITFKRCRVFCNVRLETKKIQMLFFLTFSHRGWRPIKTPFFLMLYFCLLWKQSNPEDCLFTLQADLFFGSMQCFTWFWVQELPMRMVLRGQWWNWVRIIVTRELWDERLMVEGVRWNYMTGGGSAWIRTSGNIRSFRGQG